MADQKNRLAPTTVRERTRAALHRVYRWGREHVPPGVRSVLGVLLIVGGVFGFLPVLGFWMIPVGAVLMALDIPPLRRRLRRKLEPLPETESAQDDPD